MANYNTNRYSKTIKNDVLNNNSLFSNNQENAISGAGVSPDLRNNSDMFELTLSLPQAAKALGISLDTLNQLCNKKLLRSFHIGRRHFVSWDAITEFIKNQEEAEQW